MKKIITTKIKENIKTIWWDLSEFTSTYVFPVIVAIIALIAIVFALAFVLAFPVKWLWNWLMPEIFNLMKITYWQAWGMLLLASLIFNRGGNSSSNKEPRKYPYDFTSNEV